MKVSDLLKLEYRDEEVFKKCTKNATITHIKEIPFKSNEKSGSAAKGTLIHLCFLAVRMQGMDALYARTE